MTNDVIHKLTVYKSSNVALKSVAIPLYKLVSEDKCPEASKITVDSLRILAGSGCALSCIMK